jgi:hypothetical protein
MTEIQPLRSALLELHRVLLAHQRLEAERVGGRMSASELLQAAAEDLRFSWLQELSTLIAALDEAVGDEEAGPEAVEAIVDRARTLIDPPDEATGFGKRYLRALQEDPAAVLAHRDVTAALAA